jgi:hypothetical protein
MAILLGFAPFILFSLLTNVSVDLALWLAFAAAFAIGIRDFGQSRILRLLDVASVVLFGLLSLYAGFIQPSISVPMARLAANGGLFAIALFSILVRNPFTLQYAREQVPKEFWETPRFIWTNYMITGAWAIAFAVMAAADALVNIEKQLPVSLDIAVGLATLAVAIVFTARYPAYLRAHAGRMAAIDGRKSV